MHGVVCVDKHDSLLSTLAQPIAMASQPNLVWVSDDPRARSKQIRAMAATWSWSNYRGSTSRTIIELQRTDDNSSGQTSREPQCAESSTSKDERPRANMGLKRQRSCKRNEGPDKVSSYIQSYQLEASQLEIPRPMAEHDPEMRFLSTFLPRFRAIDGPDALVYFKTAFRQGDDLIREAYHALLVGVGSVSHSTDRELKLEALDRYCRLLQNIKLRLQHKELATSTSTLIVLLLLIWQEAMVWKVLGSDLIMSAVAPTLIDDSHTAPLNSTTKALRASCVSAAQDLSARRSNCVCSRTFARLWCVGTLSKLTSSVADMSAGHA